jgi:hypothetical protein
MKQVCWFRIWLIPILWRCKRNVPTKHRMTFTKLHGVISQNCLYTFMLLVKIGGSKRGFDTSRHAVGNAQGILETITSDVLCQILPCCSHKKLFPSLNNPAPFMWQQDAEITLRKKQKLMACKTDTNAGQHPSAVWFRPQLLFLPGFMWSSEILPVCRLYSTIHECQYPDVTLWAYLRFAINWIPD